MGVHIHPCKGTMCSRKDVPQHAWRHSVVSCTKMAEQIEMLFGFWTRAWGSGSDAALCQITLTTCFTVFDRLQCTCKAVTGHSVLCWKTGDLGMSGVGDPTFSHKLPTVECLIPTPPLLTSLASVCTKIQDSTVLGDTSRSHSGRGWRPVWRGDPLWQFAPNQPARRLAVHS